ncbi:hypothetical protein [Krasilnikovia sp. MM14-A1259]|uniref:hypothetical protein n=1 Tax=Krasilnikovia sp. MM14-A1259 TaxID=3373539 RepID=UPI0038244FA2
MTYDVIALVPEIPDPRDIVAGMVAAGEQLRVAETANGAVIQLCDDTGRPLVSLETPVHVRVPDEISRLLGPELGARVTGPVWWLEARAPSDQPAAVALAHRYAHEIARRLNGHVWPPEAP